MFVTRVFFIIMCDYLYRGKHEVLGRCWFSVGPESETMRHYWSALVRGLVFAGNHDNGLSLFQINIY